MPTELERRLADLGLGDHVCPIHDQPEERLAIVLPFLAHGLARGERCLMVRGELAVDAIYSGLAARGVEVERELARGALEVLTVEESYLSVGPFEPGRMIDYLAEAQRSALERDFAGLRFLGQMSWAPRTGIEDQRLFEYEALLNGFVADRRAIVFCQYERPRFDPAVIHDVLRTHPVAVINTFVCQNPYYEPPELLLNPEPEASQEFKRQRVEWWIDRLREAHAVERERELLEEELRQAQKMEAIGQLAGGIAHDFNNLLTIITGSSELVLESLPADDPMRELVEEVRLAAERSAALTRQLLAFSRKEVLAPRILDLNEVVRDTEKMLRRLIREDVRLTTVLDPRLGAIRADRGQLEQVLLNLALNARDAMPRGGNLRIETRGVELGAAAAEARGLRPGSYVLLEVTDTGEGMPAAVRERIFEPFFTTKPSGTGTGLGLAVVKGIVERSEGAIEVASEPGTGTTFRIYLPHTDAEAQTEPGVSESATTRELRGHETVLLVEDHDGVRALTRHILADRGYRVLDARGGDEALRLCTEHRQPIDLLVTDVVMPGMSGPSLAERLLAIYPAMRVLYVSGYADDAVLRQGVEQEQINFLQKPFTVSALVAKVSEILDR